MNQNNQSQSCGTCMFFRDLKGKSKVGPVPPRTGECRHSAPVMFVITRPNTQVGMNPVSGKVENRTVIENEVKSMFPIVDGNDWGCSQYDCDYGKINEQHDGTEF